MRFLHARSRCGRYPLCSLCFTHSLCVVCPTPLSVWSLSTHARTTTGYSLSIKRLVLRNLALTPASGAGGLPRLLPLGLFDSVPRNLTIMDCRIFVSPETFQEYLAFFKKQLRTSRNSSAAGPSMHTVRVSVGACVIVGVLWANQRPKQQALLCVCGCYTTHHTTSPAPNTSLLLA